MTVRTSDNNHSKDYIQVDNKNLFDVFNQKELNIDWKNVSILDYGCNQGNYINSASKIIDTTRYCGLDLLKLSIEKARENHRGINFIHYDKWHQCYNPSGDRSVKITDVIKNKFDVIICYSVFTHCTMEQFQSDIMELKKLLNSDGKILFTIWRSEIFPHFFSWIENNRPYHVTPLNFESLNPKNFLYWIDYDYVVTDVSLNEHQETISFNTFYKLDWFKEKFKEFLYLGRPPFQHQELFCLSNKS